MKRSIFIMMIFFLFISLSALGESQNEKGVQIQNNWSSVDDVLTKQKENVLVKKFTSNPIKIGFTSKEVQEVMGVPDRIDQEENIFYYRQSAIYFNDEWKVQSWDNRYGNLYTLAEIIKIKLGYHILEVFKEKGIPLRITKVDQSYRLEYCDEVIYVGSNWQVEAIQPILKINYKTDRDVMSLMEFIEEFNSYLKNH